MPTYLITGCSRGLGLELATQLASKSSQATAFRANLVFAASRGTPTPALQALIDRFSGNVVHIQLEATSEESIKGAVADVRKHLKTGGVGEGLDVLINNAGIMEFAADGIATMTNPESSFATNVLGVHVVTSAFLPLLKKGSEKKVFNISTTLGSMTLAPTYAVFAAPAYKITKAALNMLTVQYSQEYADQGFTFITLSPGWLKTDLGSDQADLTVEEGAEATLRIIHEKGHQDTGKFFNILVKGWENAPGMNYYDGKVVAW